MHEFSKEDIQYIVDNWGKESPYSMKKKFNCTWYAVCKVAREHGLEIPTSNEWTEEEIQKLKVLSEKYDKAKIAKLMGKSENAIYLKAKRLNITLIQSRRKWKKEEEEILKELWGAVSIEYLAKKLKRTVFSLKVKAIKMGIGPMINNNLEVLTVNDISDILDVSRDRITITWVKLGLNLKKLKLTKNRCYYTITLEDLMEFLEKNQDIWDSRKVESHGLGYEPEWLLEKRKRDRNENPQGYKKWTDYDKKRAEVMLKLGKTYEEIAAELNRSEFAVATVLRDLGHVYELSKYWTDEEINYLKENIDNMTYKELANALDRTEGSVRWKAEEVGYQKKLRRKK